jgi:hypothetical protein
MKRLQREKAFIDYGLRLKVTADKKAPRGARGFVIA